MTLRRVELENFKAFERFTLRMKGDAFLVGPNNAGKSTLIAAIRAGANMLRIAKRLSASESERIDGSIRWGHGFTSEQVGLVHENLRHEFHQADTQLRFTFDGGGELVATWAVGDDSGGFFYLRKDDVALRQPKVVRAAFPDVGLIPVLSPIDHEEEPLSEKHVRSNIDGRLASRHFRNQLYLLQHEVSGTGTHFDDFCAFAAPWLTGLTLRSLKLSMGGDRVGLDLFYREPASNVEKEVFWVGDGMQIWLQLLLHLYRLREADVVVLDEPDVFLHADLQRRLVELTESLPAQVITATHSPEVLAEANPGSVIWISRNRRQGVVAPNDRLLFELSDSLGTQFNLRLARTLRARCVLFVEGKDAKVLRRLARTVGADRLAREEDLVIVSLDGVDRSEHLAAFAWLTDKVLEQSVKTFVVLDRDYRDAEAVSEIEDELTAAGIDPHVWLRHELENYLIHPAAIARVSGAEVAWVERELADLLSGFEEDLYSGVAAAMDRRLRRRRVDAKDIAKLAKRAADTIWSDPTTLCDACPGKEVISRLNARLQGAGHRTVRPRQLADRLRAGEVPPEMRDILLKVDSAAGLS